MKSFEDTKKAGIGIHASFIICLPGEDDEMVENTIRFAIDLSPEIAMFYLPLPYPGSELFRTCKESGGLRDNYKWDDFLMIDYDNPVYVNPILGIEKMKCYYTLAHKKFYSRPKVFLQNLKHVNPFLSFRKFSTVLRMVSKYV